MTKPKKSDAVHAATVALAEKGVALAKAQEAVKHAQQEVSDARRALIAAQEVADSALPQCRCVSISRYGSGNPSDAGTMVILRKTPSGLLVVRRLGQPGGGLHRFKWSRYSEVYREQKATSFYSGAHLELRDVPVEFMPSSEAA